MTFQHPDNDPRPDDYDDQLTRKISDVEILFENFSLPVIEVFHSPPLHYRLRAEFKILYRNDQVNYAMYQPGTYKKPYVITEFKLASKLINQLMPLVLDTVNQSEVLRRRLFSVEFLTTLSGEALITLLYHRPLDNLWETEAKELGKITNAHIMGRSRKQKIVLDQDYVTERLDVAGIHYHYRQVESEFTQPNGVINEKMLAWTVAKSKHWAGDLLELYCGNGNFTVPISRSFNKVLATEVGRSSVNSAIFNLAENSIDNVKVVRMASEEISQALRGVRPFRRLRDIDLEGYNFSTVFVDPPRVGLDETTRELLTRFDNVIYISCNPLTLQEDLASLTQDYQIDHFAIFDQFPFTPHTECGVVLRRRAGFRQLFSDQ